MTYDFDKLEKTLLKLDLNITDRMKEQFAAYYEILIKWNQVMNLTSIIEFDEVVEKHFLDSIAMGYYIDLNHELKLIDVGTGAGFPGIPLKIVFPNIKVLLADSLNKRVKFLNEVILQLNLEYITAVHGRAEELAQKELYREQFDLCVSRAVANLASLSEYCLPFVKTGGKFIAYKSCNVDYEVEQSKNAIAMLGGNLEQVKKFFLPDTEYQRSFVIVDKIKHTKRKYPRKAGTPSKMPLGIER